MPTHVDVDVFVNRASEITAVIKATRELSSGYIKECILNVWGVPGIGKSRFLARLLDEAQCELVQQGTEVDWMLIDLKASQAAHATRTAAHATAVPLSEEHQLLDEKRRFFSCVQEASSPVVTRLIEGLVARFSTEDVALSEMHVDLAITDMADTLKSGAAERPLLLLIDSCEEASDALFAWIEHMLLLPLVHTDRLFCVLTSQVMLRWRQFNVRRRVQVQQLTPFNDQHTVDQALQRDSLGRAVYAISFGHPLSSRVVLKHVYQRFPPPLTVEREQAAVQWLEAHQLDVIKGVIGELLQRVAPVLDNELRILFSDIALFREFDVNTLRRLLSQLPGNQKQHTQSSLLIKIRRLLETRLVSWNATLRAYQIDGTVRRIFAQGLRSTDPGRYQTICRIATKHYEEQVEAVPSNRVLYLRELFFQYLSDPSCDRCDEASLKRELREYLNTYFINTRTDYRDISGVLDLGQKFKEDKELSILLTDRKLSPLLLANTVNDFRREYM